MFKKIRIGVLHPQSAEMTEKAVQAIADMHNPVNFDDPVDKVLALYRRGIQLALVEIMQNIETYKVQPRLAEVMGRASAEALDNAAMVIFAAMRASGVDGEDRTPELEAATVDSASKRLARTLKHALDKGMEEEAGG